MTCGALQGKSYETAAAVPTSSRRVPEVEKIVEQPEEELEMLKKKH